MHAMQAAARMGENAHPKAGKMVKARIMDASYRVQL